MEYCSKPLTAESQERAEEAKRAGTLFTLGDDLFCECGQRVGARSQPWMDGPKGGPLAPTLHDAKKISRKPVNPAGKPGCYKS